jgi:lipopolysaccharide transport system ATP-binding protein
LTKFQQKCIDRMDTLIRRDGRTVLLVSHNIRQIERLCTRALLLDHGRLVQTGSPRDVCRTFFEYAQQQHLQRRQGEMGSLKPQRDAGVIEVFAVEFLDDQGQLVDSIGFHESLTLRIRFRCSTPLLRPEIIVGFHTSDFVQVLSASNAMSGAQPNLDVGEHEVCCRFDQIALRPFTYGLKLLFVDNRNGTLWSSECIRFLAVSPGQADITKFPTTGLVFSDSSWKFDGAGANMHSVSERVVAE